METKQPQNVEIEVKYLIALPNTAQLKQYAPYEVTEITQTYLQDEDATKGMRVRKRGVPGRYSYTQTYKEDITAVKRIEIEKELTEAEYKELLKKADPRLSPIKKERHCFTYKNQAFELDIYPFWKEHAILELELNVEEQEIHLPPFIRVIKEVTRDLRYRNYSLAKNIIDEKEL